MTVCYFLNRFHYCGKKSTNDLGNNNSDRMTFMGFQGYGDGIGFVTELFRQFLHGFTCLRADFVIVF